MELSGEGEESSGGGHGILPPAKRQRMERSLDEAVEVPSGPESEMRRTSETDETPMTTKTDGSAEEAVSVQSMPLEQQLSIAQGRVANKKKCIENMTGIEVEFDSLKEILLKKRLEELDAEFELAKREKHPEYLQMKEKLELEMSRRLEEIEVWNKLRLASLLREYNVEREAAKNDCLSEKESFLRNLQESIVERRTKLEETDSLSLTSDGFQKEIAVLCASASSLRNLRGSESLSTSNRKAPHFSLSLKEPEILEDLVRVEGRKVAVAHTRTRANAAEEREKRVRRRE